MIHRKLVPVQPEESRARTGASQHSLVCGIGRPSWKFVLLVFTLMMAAVLLIQRPAGVFSSELRRIRTGPVGIVSGVGQGTGSEQVLMRGQAAEMQATTLQSMPQFIGLPSSCEACLDGNNAYSVVVKNTPMMADTLSDWPPDARDDTRLRFDFDCLDWHSYQWYHRLVDCLVQVAGLLHPLIASRGVKSVSVGVAVYPFWHWFESVLRETNTSFTRSSSFSVLSGTRTRHAVDASVRINMTSHDHNIMPLRHTEKSCKPCLRDVAMQAVGIPKGVPCDTIVLVSRQVNRRRILDEDALYDRLVAVVNAGGHAAKHVVRAFGNETMDDMVRLFARACVVVGYHGAGLANTMFNPSGSMVVEVTTYAAPYYTEPYGKECPWRAAAIHMGIWRTNNDVVQHLGTATKPVHVDWSLYMIEFDRLQSPLPLPAASATVDTWNAYIVDANVVLGRQHIDNIGMHVEQFLVTKAKGQV